jgi:uncharacterized protein (DUF2164 family)
METMKKLLRRITEELGIQWFNYGKKENETKIVEIIVKYLHTEFKKIITM